MPVEYSEETDRFTINSVGKYLSEERICDIFCKKQIRFTPPNEFNDPLEFKPTLKGSNIYNDYVIQGSHYPSKADFISHAIVAYFSVNNGVLSLTKVLDSFYMWSMYANGHKGFFIVLKDDFNNQKELMDGDILYPIKKVDYTNDYCLEIDVNFIDQSFVDEFAKSNYDKILFSKINRWIKEEEYRIVRPLKNKEDRLEKSLFQFDVGYITDVVFGASMITSNKLIIKELCESGNINFHQAMLIKDEKDYTNELGKVVILKIPEDIPWAILTQMTELNFCTTMEKLKTGSNEISKLEELPYPPERVILKK